MRWLTATIPCPASACACTCSAIASSCTFRERLANTLTPDSLHLRQANRNELIVSLLARCTAPSGLGRTRLMDRRGDGVPIIRRECKELSGRLPEYRLIDDSELLLVMRAAE